MQVLDATGAEQAEQGRAEQKGGRKRAVADDGDVAKAVGSDNSSDGRDTTTYLSKKESSAADAG